MLHSPLGLFYIYSLIKKKKKMDNLTQAVGIITRVNFRFKKLCLPDWIILASSYVEVPLCCSCRISSLAWKLGFKLKACNLSTLELSRHKLRWHVMQIIISLQVVCVHTSYSARRYGHEYLNTSHI